jgi:predicted nuclease with RNAse H fold
LTETLRVEGVEVVELHPGAVHKARGEMGQRRLKSDLRDLAAMVELLARGTGRASRWEDGPIAIQAVWSAHRRRRHATPKPIGSGVSRTGRLFQRRDPL